MRTPPLDKEYLEALDFYRLFLQLITELHTKAKFQMTWYRGQSRNWPLIPVILRYPDGDKTGAEAGILNSFKRLASAQMTRPLSSREWYYLAQHHGLPTRLLDWTANPRIALWFAIKKDDGQDGFIYIIDSAYYRRDDILNSLTLIENDYYETVFGNGSFDETIKKWDGKIKAVFPDCYNARQIRQTSMFTLHLPGESPEKITPRDLILSKDGIENASLKWDEIFLEKNHPISIQIPQAYKLPLRRLLSIEGLHLWDVFPDLDHIATGLKEEIFGTNPAVSPPANNKTK